MTAMLLDTTDRDLTGATIVSHGYEGVCRYIANAPVSGAIDKEMRAVEVAEKSAAGCRLVANFEWGERPADTVSEGQRHAGVFLQWVDAVKAPAWSPCYFSLDANNPAGAYHNYFTGVVRELESPSRAGVYGNGACYRSLLSAGLVTLAWHSKSSSYAGNHDTTGANLVQRLATVKVGGYTVDVNDAKTPYYGGWLLGEDDPMALTPDDVDSIATAVVAKIKADPSDLDLKWRVHAVANALDEYAAGSMKGRPVPLTALLKALPRELAVTLSDAQIDALAGKVSPAVAAELRGLVFVATPAT